MGEDALRQEEFDLLVGELAQLGAEHIVDADMVRISPAARGQKSAKSEGSKRRDGCGSAATVAFGRAGTHDRYATVREGSWLK